MGLHFTEMRKELRYDNWTQIFYLIFDAGKISFCLRIVGISKQKMELVSGSGHLFRLFDRERTPNYQPF